MYLEKKTSSAILPYFQICACINTVSMCKTTQIECFNQKRNITIKIKYLLVPNRGKVRKHNTPATVNHQQFSVTWFSHSRSQFNPRETYFCYSNTSRLVKLLPGNLDTLIHLQKQNSPLTSSNQLKVIIQNHHSFIHRGG